MNIAQHVISKLGVSVERIAAGLGVRPAVIWRMAHPRERGGRGGLVPARYQLPMLLWARKQGIPLRPEDFFGLDAELNPLPHIELFDEKLTAGPDSDQFNRSTGMNGGATPAGEAS